MRIKHWVDKQGRATSVAQLNAADRAALRRKNIAKLHDQIAWRNVFNETVSFADKEIQDESISQNSK